MVISNGFIYMTVIILIAGVLLWVQKYVKWKPLQQLFRIVPPLVWVYVLNMLFCTLGFYKSEAVTATYNGLVDYLLYAMIFVMLLQCDFKRIIKLGPKLILVFIACTLTLAIGFIAFFPLFKNGMGGGENVWAATAALFSSWVGGTANMAAMRTVYQDQMNMSAYSCAMAVDTVCASVWIVVLMLGARMADKWNKAVKAKESDLDKIAAEANAMKKEEQKPTNADWLFLIGISFVVSVIAGEFGGIVLVLVLGLIAALTPMKKLKAIEEYSGVLLYIVIGMMASQAPLNALLDAPLWVAYGFAILILHGILMFLISRIFHWEIKLVAIGSMANIGGTGSAPVVASFFDKSLAGIAIVMGLLGAAIGNFIGLGMGWILRLLA